MFVDCTRMDENGGVRVRCEKCGSANVDLDGWDIDKCGDCGHWRYRGDASREAGDDEG